MAIADGYRTHDDEIHPRYRMPDLLTLDEMKMYFAGTYGVGLDLRPLTDAEKEASMGVGTLPYTPQINDKDRELAILREKLGLNSLEAHVGMKRSIDPNNLDPVVELDSRVMTKADFDAKYASQEAEVPSQGKRTPSQQVNTLLEEKKK